MTPCTMSLLQELASLDRNAEDARLEECLEAVELDYLLARCLQVAVAQALQQPGVRSVTLVKLWRLKACWHPVSHRHSSRRP